MQSSFWLCRLALCAVLIVGHVPCGFSSSPSSFPEQDLQAVLIYRKGINSVLEFLRLKRSLFPADSTQMPSAEQKEQLRETWKSALDYYLALDSIISTHKDFYRVKSKEARGKSFSILYTAVLTEYRHAIELIEFLERHPSFDPILNEAVPDLGLDKNTYQSFKTRFLNPVRTAELTALGTVRIAQEDDNLTPEIWSFIREDRKFIWKSTAGKRQLLATKNNLHTVRKAGYSLWLPAQTEISEWMGDTKVRRKKKSLITSEQIHALQKILQPGDILLERREWYLSNVGLPGFWPHGALYIGTPEERKIYFAEDSEVMTWVRSKGRSNGDLEDLLQSISRTAYDKCLQPQEDDHLPRIIEAISEGVCFTTLEHSADADSVAVLRPRISRKEKAAAIYKAFQYIGRPYDFDFNFLTDSALVCTELVYKAYEPSTECQGVCMPVKDIMGHKVMPANELARLFDQQYGTTEQQFDLVIFLDGKEWEQNAVEASVSEFRESWKRPKWHILKK